MRRVPEGLHDEICDLFRSGFSQSEIGIRFGFTENQIRTVLHKCGLKLSLEESHQRTRTRAKNALRIRTPKPRLLDPARPYMIRDCVAAAAAITGLPFETLMAGRRKKYHCRARNAIYHLCAPYFSYMQLGRAFGGRDHSTVIYGCEVAAGMLVQSQDFRDLVAAIDQRAREIAAHRMQAVCADLERLAA